MRSLIVLGALAALLASCSSPYQSKGFRGGFTEIKMANDTYRIQFSGNAFTGTDATSEMAMLRAAELTLAAGYSHLTVMDASDSTDRSYFFEYDKGHATLLPISKPTSEVIIRMYVSMERKGLDAREIYDRLAPKYRAE